MVIERPSATVPDDGLVVIENVPGTTGALTVSEYVDVCEPDVAVPVILRAYVPTGVLDEVATNSEEDPPEVTEVGVKVALAPAGSPVTESATLWDEPLVVAVLTVALVDEPWTTEPELGATLKEKSLPGACPVTIGPEISHALLALDHVACIAKEPVAKATFCAPPAPPVPTQAHKSPFS